jgi:hypothetical protein
MKNPTVKQAIEALSKLHPDAILCRMDFDEEEQFYSTVEIVKSVGKSKYIDDAGDFVEGEIVIIY